MYTLIPDQGEKEGGSITKRIKLYPVDNHNLRSTSIHTFVEWDNETVRVI